MHPPARRLKSRATGSDARLRGLDLAIPDYFLKNHKSRVMESDARLRRLNRSMPDDVLNNHKPALNT